MTLAHILDHKGHDVVTARAGMSLKEIADILSAHNIGAVVVLTEADRVCGIVSERDIVRHLSVGGAVSLEDPVWCRMTSDVVFGDPSDTIDAALEKMNTGRFRHLPIVRGDVLIGLVSIGDVVSHKIAAGEQNTSDLIRYITNESYAA
ncbi:CBS domain-containing protein [uncultured Tateyamaria sp.]|uniref:CBS domain-containing protein n=1 Tax=uncultured Tateyamaria sp. TaxID=455651 RepID=UPI00260C77FE|nr:CBS domain-containing protein [uncultured Tateyamaria sp.]